VTAAIEIDRATAGYTSVPVLAELSLRVGPRQIVAVVGRSGSGKTTLLRLVAGLIAPTSGSVAVLGASPLEARRAKRLGLVAQDARLHPWLSVLGNVELPLRVNTTAARDGHVAPREWLARAGLDGAERRYPHELSGGMRQRVALVRALVTAPELLLMDEPLASLDEITREELRVEIAALWESSGCAVVYVTHDLDEAVLVADRVVVIGGRPARVLGEVRVEAPRPRAATVARDPLLAEAADAVRALLR
jgi:NitT/TauT family transport system ATP-binding protein